MQAHAANFLIQEPIDFLSLIYGKILSSFSIVFSKNASSKYFRSGKFGKSKIGTKRLAFPFRSVFGEWTMNRPVSQLTSLHRNPTISDGIPIEASSLKVDVD
ncbi:MAG: hypothetical protein FWH27_04370 [Planctomycetaceae bacterium]|nr:hypothetical protein [Planctomycetaceae bacterium]